MKPLVPKEADVVAFISNCGAKSFRLQALEALSANFTVHSYGRCLHNVDTRDPKADVLRRYKFTLAFENSQVMTRPAWSSTLHLLVFFCTKRLSESESPPR